MGESQLRGVDPRFYFDPEIFALELDLIFARTWHLVGHASQVASPGQVITAQVGDESVMVVNDAGKVHGLYNVCQHRGHQLVADEEATLSALSCPYHAWTYALNGELLSARGEDVGPLCIPAVQVDILAGFLFVNLDPRAAPLKEAVPGVEAELLAFAPDARSQVLASRRTQMIDANWKVAVENYNECYHCPNVHKSFTTAVVSPGSYRISMQDSIIRHSADGSPASRSGHDGCDETNRYVAYFTWPVSSIQCYPQQALNTFRWVPLAVDRTMLIREWWLDSADPTPQQQEAIERDWTTTVVEDLGIMESVQRGVASRGYQPGPLIVDPCGVAGVHAENSVAHLQGLLLDALGGG